jgi:hypothetical protein
MTGSLGGLDSDPQLHWRVQDRHRLGNVRPAHAQPPRETGAVSDRWVSDRLPEGQRTG